VLCLSWQTSLLCGIFSAYSPDIQAGMDIFFVLMGPDLLYL